MHELSKQFRFDAAHTLERDIGTDSSRRIHGHSYRGEVVVRGIPDPATGMLVDLGALERLLDDARSALDHHFLNEVADLGPATLENLCSWIWNRLSPTIPNLAIVRVHRDSGGEVCSYYGPSS
ncbi:MAG: 6-carboxytetrahydropterin synthase [Alphaproteobacteria bacterium]|nr:6-carboxytetrahydropterin synthase [Alphaproteobacteria bacterium]MBU0798501.1 6-carboxytetrahydropterin synthase [Alphaproteobacteria bacterium]MBU0888310.1 6-carboxytetrahydropterin synthase [Alphaproteobacteria bacterium]MBU1812859.1 6-carboxytetrahydropterin synthase [Alphaproteobacteria bacterium]